MIERADLSADTERGIREALAQAREAGDAVLRAGGSALDAVQATVVALEESPHFNAGKGAVFDADGRHELDASIMDGATLRAGAVAGVTDVRNPVVLARRVMEDSPHVMLIGAGASRFADTQADIERVANDWYDTPHRLQQLHEEQAREREAAEGEANNLKGRYFGTVGAVALDVHGNIAAATSTGGMTNKRWGRVGDTPVIGGGTYADARCGVSATGWGEFFLRLAVAHDICARVAYRGDSLKQAVDDVILRALPALGGDGGAIAIDREGNIAMPFNTSGMYRAWVKPDGSRGVAIFGDEG
ncbi:isoaspartyl peptidase/L-asparaginase [Lysobacter lycopersici]